MSGTKLIIVLSVSSFIALNIAANILMKIGATVPVSQRIVFDLAGWQALVGACLLAASAIAYTLALRYLPLNIAQSFAVLQFIGVVLAANLILSEPIGAMRWLGMGLIALGIVVVSLTTEA